MGREKEKDKESEMKEVSIYHISEQFLYEYYCRPGEYRIREENRAEGYLEKAREQERRSGLMGAYQNYQRAHEENPVSMAPYDGMILCLWKIHDYETLLQCAKECHPFCCTRAELARYYRYRGLYCLETYQPQLAQVLYRYSTLWYPSKQAEEEIHYLETALGEPMPSYTTEQLQEKLRQEQIPLGPSETTLSLLALAAEQALRQGLRGQARDCYEMIFDLTQDEQIREKLGELQD